MSESRPMDQNGQSDSPGAARVTQPTQLAYIGPDGQIFVRRFPSDTTHQLTWSWQDQHAPQPLQGPQDPESQPAPPSMTYSWPTWSPDNAQLACFARQGEDGPASVYTVAADGVESWERASLGQGAPIYGNWSPRADMFTVLVQRGERQLALETIAMTQPGQTHTLLTGAPLFWSWAPQGQLVAAHVGDNETGRVVLIEAATGTIVREISARPGTFRVPVWSPDGELLTYVERGADGSQTLRLFDIQSGENAPISRASGMTTALWSPDGQALVFSSTQRQGSMLSPSLHLLDLSSGQSTTLLETPVAGFLWAPHGTSLVYLSVDIQHSQLRWHQYDRTTGESLELVRFLPSREQTLQFSFFDQYAGSHPLLAPDGTLLTFTGHLPDAATQPATTAPTVYTLPLTPPFTPQAIATGSFACWNLRAG